MASAYRLKLFENCCITGISDKQGNNSKFLWRSKDINRVVGEIDWRNSFNHLSGSHLQSCWNDSQSMHVNNKIPSQDFCHLDNHNICMFKIKICSKSLFHEIVLAFTFPFPLSLYPCPSSYSTQVYLIRVAWEERSSRKESEDIRLWPSYHLFRLTLQSFLISQANFKIWNHWGTVASYIIARTVL